MDPFYIIPHDDLQSTKHEPISCEASNACKFCGLVFNRKYNLRKHEEKCQLEADGNKIQRRNPCLFPSCKQTFYHKSRLIQHLQNFHNVPLEPTVVKTFDTFMEFEAWKKDEEESTFSYFSIHSNHNHSTKNNDDKRNSGTMRRYYYCQHDGRTRRATKTSRRNKKGRIKVGHHCIAKMDVREDEQHKITVKYFPTHNHACRPEDVVHHPNYKRVNEQMSSDDCITDASVNEIMENDDLHAFNENLSFLSTFALTCSRSALSHAVAVSNELVAQLKSMDGTPAMDTLPTAEQSLESTSDERFKKQVASFSRKRKTGSQQKSKPCPKVRVETVEEHGDFILLTGGLTGF